MDIRELMTTARGRIGRRTFWAAASVLILLAFVAGFVPVLGALCGLALLIPAYCLMAKRLHDMGRPGWLALVPAGASAFAGFIAVTIALMAFDPALGPTAIALAGTSHPISIAALVISLGFLLWTGLGAGDMGRNRYGAPEAEFIGQITFSPY